LFPKAVTSLDGYFITHVAAGWSHSGFVSGLLSSGYVFTVFVNVEFFFPFDVFFLVGFQILGVSSLVGMARLVNWVMAIMLHTVLLSNCHALLISVLCRLHVECAIPLS